MSRRKEAWWAWDLGGLQGTDQADEIYGYGGNDVLSGRDGNDVLDGGEGTDLMNGGAGDDTYYVDNVGDVVVDADVYDPGLWTYDAGYDTVVSTVDFTLHHSVERLFLAEGSRQPTAPAIRWTTRSTAIRTRTTSAAAAATTGSMATPTTTG